MDNDKLRKLLVGWQDFYKKVFELDVDLSGLAIPPEQPGFDRLLVIAKGITIQEAYDACQKLFPCWKDTDDSLDKVASNNDRVTDQGTYAIWVRDRQEPDEELKNESVIDLVNAKILTITLLERIIFELKFFRGNNDHLDKKGVTLCAGSLDCNGYAFQTDWYGDTFCVFRYRPHYVGDLLCAREVISS